MNPVEATRIELGHGSVVVRGTFSLPPGRTAVLGPNGSGKTTLLLALQGFPVLQNGELKLLGTEVRKYPPRDRARDIAVVPQDVPATLTQTVRDTIRIGLLSETGWWKPFPPDTESRLDRCVHALGLEGLQYRSVDRLSTGERQKVILAQALIQRPKLLLLDEPTSHLDPGAAHRFWSALERTSGSALVTTHDLQFARTHCHWILALKNGSVDYCGPSGEFFQSDRHRLLYEIS